MITVSILIFDGVVPSSVTSVTDLLEGANRFNERQGQPPAFAIELAGKQPFAHYLQPGSQILYRELDHTRIPDLVIVPSFSVADVSITERSTAEIEWIRSMRAGKAEIASLCAGCYFLAEAGLLNGMEATSHWAVQDDLRRRYPAIEIKSDLVITDKDGIYTSGGAFSSLKLVLYLIEKFCGRKTALWISKMFAIDMSRSSQGHFAMFTGLHQHDDKEILKAQTYIEEHYHNELSMEAVADHVCMGSRNFIRRFKLATNNTPFEYLQRVRIESAKKALELSEDELPQIIDQTGYTDVKAFRTVFKRITGLTPLEYRKKYGRN
jgi:transcriptional regulator GlxA family with amidase domain